MSHYVHLDFLKLGILYDSKVTPSMLKLYVSYLARADNKTMECFPSRERSVIDTGISHVNNVTDTTRKLEELGYLVRKGVKGKKNVVKVLTPSRSDVIARAGGNMNAENDGPQVEVTRSQDEVPKQNILGDPKQKSLGEPQAESATHNCINITNKELIIKSTDWMSLTYPKFKAMKDRPDYTETFNRAWVWYKRKCKEMESMEGDKLTAFLRWLQLNQSLTLDEMRKGLMVYIQKKKQANSTLAHFSTLLNNQPMFEQFLEEADEINDSDKTASTQEAEAPKRDFSRFAKLTSTPDSRQNDNRGEADIRKYSDAPLA